jgi:hypothetical protein
VTGFTALTVVSTVLNGAVGELRAFALLQRSFATAARTSTAFYLRTLEVPSTHLNYIHFGA